MASPELRAWINHHRRVVWLQEPWHFDKVHEVQLARDRRRGNCIDLRGRIQREGIAEIRAHYARAGGIQREEKHVGGAERGDVAQFRQA